MYNGIDMVVNLLKITTKIKLKAKPTPLSKYL